MTTCTPRAAWVNLLRRLHFSIGLFVGPFIFIAALTGALYVATPQLENVLWRSALTAAGATYAGQPIRSLSVGLVAATVAASWPIPASTTKGRSRRLAGPPLRHVVRVRRPTRARP